MQKTINHLLQWPAAKVTLLKNHLTGAPAAQLGIPLRSMFGKRRCCSDILITGGSPPASGTQPKTAHPLGQQGMAGDLPQAPQGRQRELGTGITLS